jgi:signal transduction histidine kinase
MADGSTGMSSQGHAADAQQGDTASLIGTVHLVLAATSLITVFVDSTLVRTFSRLTWLIFVGFTIHNVVLYVMAHQRRPSADSRHVLWLDIFWYALLVYITGSNNSLFFLFFFFSILIASFRFGFDEGARITLASAALFSLTALSATDSAELVQVLLRAAFMLALGYMIANWGETNLRQKRELGLLRDVSRLSNPRFGVDQTTKTVMERTRAFFAADACILVIHRPGSPRWTLRTVSEAGDRPSDFTAAAGVAATPPLMVLPAGQAVCYLRPLVPRLRWTGQFCAYDAAGEQWTELPGDAGEHLADLLEARAFISAPLAFHNGEGRVFLVSATRSFGHDDALFLCHILAQVVPVLENIHLLDRLASEAAQRERQTMSRDLHDRTVQPYIGLSHTLSALRNKATPDNPLTADIDKLATMAAEVVGDLRRFAGGFAREQAIGEPLAVRALRQHLAQVKQFYDLDIALQAEDDLEIGDRLAAAMFQLVCEGASNIRKHAQAREGSVHISCSAGALHIDIANPGGPGPFLPFTPVSIARRTAALGGTVRVEQRADGSTVVCIAIPV